MGVRVADMGQWWIWENSEYGEDWGSVRVSSTGDEKKIAQANEKHGSIGEKVFIF